MQTSCLPCCVRVPSCKCIRSEMLTTASMLTVVRHLQSTTTHARTTGSGAINADRGEEPDVASPRKRKRTAGAADDSDRDGSLAGGQQHGRRGRGKKRAGGSRPERDPLAAWFRRHFAALDKQSAPLCLVQQHTLSRALARSDSQAGSAQVARCEVWLVVAAGRGLHLLHRSYGVNLLTHLCHPPADLLSASFAVGNPEAGWLPPPESKQRERCGARAGHGNPAAAGCKTDPAGPDSAPALGQQRQQSQQKPQQQQAPGKISETALAALKLGQKGPTQTAAGGGGLKSGKLSSASVPGLHSADQLSRRSVGGQPGSTLAAPRCAPRPTSSVCSGWCCRLHRPWSRAEAGCLPSPWPEAARPAMVTSSVTRSPKHAACRRPSKGARSTRHERPDRSVRSDSAPQRGWSSGLGSKPHGRLSDTALGPSQPRTAGAMEPKLKHAGGSGSSHAQDGGAHRSATGTHAGQPQHKRPAGKAPAAAATAIGKKHSAAAIVLVPMADDEQPGGSTDRNGRHHAPQKKRDAGHDRAPSAASVAACCPQSREAWRGWCGPVERLPCSTVSTFIITPVLHFRISRLLSASGPA